MRQDLRDLDRGKPVLQPAPGVRRDLTDLAGRNQNAQRHKAPVPAPKSAIRPDLAEKHIVREPAQRGRHLIDLVGRDPLLRWFCRHGRSLLTVLIVKTAASNRVLTHCLPGNSF